MVEAKEKGALGQFSASAPLKFHTPLLPVDQGGSNTRLSSTTEGGCEITGCCQCPAPPAVTVARAVMGVKEEMGFFSHFLHEIIPHGTRAARR